MRKWIRISFIYCLSDQNSATPVALLNPSSHNYTMIYTTRQDTTWTESDVLNVAYADAKAPFISLARCDTHVWKVVRCPFSIVNTGSLRVACDVWVCICVYVCGRTRRSALVGRMPDSSTIMASDFKFCVWMWFSFYLAAECLNRHRSALYGGNHSCFHVSRLWVSQCCDAYRHMPLISSSITSPFATLSITLGQLVLLDRVRTRMAYGMETHCCWLWFSCLLSSILCIACKRKKKKSEQQQKHINT